VTKADSAVALQEKINAKLSAMCERTAVNLSQCEVYLKPSQLLDFCQAVKVDADLSFDFLVSISGVDYLDSDFMSALRAGEGRYEVVYQFLSLKHLHRLRLKVSLPESAPEVPSITPLWPGANWMEREVFDMYGVKFSGHPDLRRIIMYEEFQGHPLRKDYPVQGKQPRVILRAPEVHNTAKDMRRATLIKINPRGNKTSLDNKSEVK
jgi:NADH-quinone oxidoreductase subunit C